MNGLKLFKQFSKHARAEAGAGTAAGRGPRVAGVLLAAAAMGAPAAAAEVETARLVQEAVVYKTTARGALHLHIVKPAGAAPAGGRPCVVFFHGGGWRRGTPRQFLAFSQLLARRGVIGMSAEYRLLGENDGALPVEAVEDARSALRWVRKNAAGLGCDVARIGAGGGSAGGHLALMTAMKGVPEAAQDDLKIDPRPAALIVLNAPLDFDGYVSPVPLAERRRLAPSALVDASLPPTLMMQGTQDKVVPYRQATRFLDKARALGARDVTLIPFEGRGHGFFNKGKGEPGDFEATAGHMIDFLHRLGWL